MWMFEGAEFKQWLQERNGRFEVELKIPESLTGRCTSCGTNLADVPFTHEGQCGFCLAYEFGEERRLERAAEAIAGIARIALSADRRALKYLCRELLDDVEEAVRFLTPRLPEGQVSDR